MSVRGQHSTLGRCVSNTTAMLVGHLLAVVWISGALAQYGPPAQNFFPPRVTAIQPKDYMVHITNNLAVNVLLEHNVVNNNNIAFSPYGLIGIIVALYEGVDGGSAFQIREGLEFPSNSDILRVGFRDIHRRLRSYFIPKEGFLAGLVFNYENVTFTQKYKDILQYYGYDFDMPKSSPSNNTSDEQSAENITTTISTMGITTVTTQKMDVTTQEMDTTEQKMDVTTQKMDVTTQKMDSTTQKMDSTTIPPTTVAMTSMLFQDTETSMPTTVILTTDLTVATSEIQTTTEMPTTITTPTTTTIPTTTTEQTTITTTSAPTTTTLSPTTTTSPSTEPITTTITSTEATTPIQTTITGLDSTETSTMDMTQDTAAETDMTNRVTRTTNAQTSIQTTKADSTTIYLTEMTKKTTQQETTTFKNEITTEMPNVETTTANFAEETTENFTEKPTTISVEESTISLDSKSLETDSIESRKKRSVYENDFAPFNHDYINFLRTYNSDLNNFEAATPIETTIARIDSTETSDMDVIQDTGAETDMTNRETRTTNAQKSIQTTKADSTTTNLTEMIKETTQPETTLFNNEMTTEMPNVEKTTENFAKEITTNSVEESKNFLDYTSLETDSGESRKKRSAYEYDFAPFNHDYINFLRTYNPDFNEIDNLQYQHAFLANGFDKVQITYMTYDTILEYAYVPYLRTMALKLPLDTSEYYLLILLPNHPQGVNQLIKDLASNRSPTLQKINRMLTTRYVRAWVPTFMLKGSVVLTNDLQKLGVCDVFEPRQNDFGPMTAEKNIYVRNIEQAITVSIRKYMEPNVKKRQAPNALPIEFAATHPFLYFVMDSEMHVALMAGKILNPRNSRIQ